MPLDKREREEIRAVVASELQDVLRQEMAQWWAESVMALAAGRSTQPPPTPAARGAATADRSAASEGTGAVSSTAGPGSEGVRPPLQGRQQAPPASAASDAALDAEYLERLAASLARRQQMLALDLQRSMLRIRGALEEMSTLADGLASLPGQGIPQTLTGTAGPGAGSGQG